MESVKRIAEEPEFAQLIPAVSYEQWLSEPERHLMETAGAEVNRRIIRHHAYALRISKSVSKSTPA